MSIIYSLIRRADFTDLYKYGQLTLNPLVTIEFNEDINGESAKNALMRNIFKHSNSFDSSFAYLIIQYKKEDYIREFPVVNIEDVEHVYPLNDEAKKEFETSFDEHIRLDAPVFSKAFYQIQELKTLRDCEKGAFNMATLYGFTEKVADCQNIIANDILQEVVEELYSNARPSGDHPIWVYLLRYERHAFYPQTMNGFFMDVVNVVCNFLSKKEVDENTVGSTGIYKVLESVPINIKSVDDIIKLLTENEPSQAFINKVKEIVPEVDFIKVAVMYLWLRSRYSEGLRFERNIAQSIAQNSAYMLSAYMLGLVFGHNKTYECLYESLPLPIYKSKEEMLKIQKRHEYEKYRAIEEMRLMEEEQQRYAKERGNGFVRGTQAEKDIRYGRKRKKDFNGVKNDRGYNQPSYYFQEDNLIKIQRPVMVKPEPKPKDVLEQPKIGLGNGFKPEVDEHKVDLFSQQELNESITIPALPCTMGKLKKGSRNEFCKNPKPITVSTKDEYIAMFYKGWRKKDI